MVSSHPNQTLISIYEIYSIKSEVSFSRKVGTIDLTKRSYGTLMYHPGSSSNILERRSDLTGVHLTITTVPFGPYYNVIQVLENGTIVPESGMVFDIFWMLKQKLKFEHTFTQPR